VGSNPCVSDGALHNDYIALFRAFSNWHCVVSAWIRGSSLDEFPGSYDVVIGSDLIFAKENIPPLVATFNEFRKKNPKTIVYLASIT